MSNRTSMPAQPNQSLINGLECLEMLVSTQQPLGSRELARMLQMEHTRVNRLLGTLASLGLTERNQNRKYAPGPGIHVLAAMSLRGSRLLASALRRLPPLMKQMKNCNIALGVLWRSYVCYIFFGVSGRPLDESIGNTAPCEAERSSIGRVLLAHLAPKAVQTVYRTRTQRCLSNTQLKQLQQDLVKVRKQKYAIVRNDSTNMSVGMTVDSPPVAGLAVAGNIKTCQISGIVKHLHAVSVLIAADLAEANIVPVKTPLHNDPTLQTPTHRRNAT